jgi:hypothetical protein
MMKSEHLRLNLRRLMLVLVASGSHSSASAKTETGTIINDIHANAQRFELLSSKNESEGKALARKAVDDMVKAIEQIEAQSYCNERAAVYLAGDHARALGELLSTVELHIVGSRGDVYLYFLSGTNLSAVAATINTLQGAIGVEALISPENPNRIKLQSILPGPDQFVTVEQTFGELPIIYPQATGWTGMFEWTDYGCAFGVPSCALPAELYLSTNATLQNYGAGSTTLIFQADAGMQLFTFASGSTQQNIIESVNTFQYYIGLHAHQCELNSDRIEIRSNLVGEYASVQVQQVGGTPPIIFTTSQGGEGEYSSKAFGVDGHPGDIDCDNNVNIADLLGIINFWGICAQPPLTCPADLTGNGLVDVDDLLSVINNWTQFD